MRQIAILACVFSAATAYGQKRPTMMDTARPRPEVVTISTPDNAPEYKTVEEPAKPGFDMAQYLAEHSIYAPATAGAKGVVLVNCRINIHGDVEDVHLEKGIDKKLDEEAVRLVKSMPRWRPAHQKGKTVRQRITLPVRFPAEAAKK